MADPPQLVRCATSRCLPCLGMSWAAQAQQSCRVQGCHLEVSLGWVLLVALKIGLISNVCIDQAFCKFLLQGPSPHCIASRLASVVGLH